MSKNKTDKTAAQQYDNYPDPDASFTLAMSRRNWSS